MKFRLFALATFCVLLVASLLACDKGKGAGNDENEDTTWTWSKCQKEGWDTVDNLWHPCDSLLYLDVRAACEWEPGEYYDSIRSVDMKEWKSNWQHWRGLKKLSPRIKEIYFNYYFHFEESPNLTEFPPEIWEIPNLREVVFENLPKLKAFPPITKPNDIRNFEVRWVSVPFPKGLKNTKINEIIWTHSSLDSISETLREIAPQVGSMMLWDCGLKTLPDWMKEFKSLGNLEIRDNQIQVLPDGLGTLPLYQVIMDDNELESLPEDFCELEERDVSKTGNHLCEISDWPTCYPKDSIVSWFKSQDCQ